MVFRRLLLPAVLVATFLLGITSSLRRGRTSPTNRSTAPNTTASRTYLGKNYRLLPLSFEPNLGQAGPQVKFLSGGSGYTLFLTGNEALLALGGQKSSVTSQKGRGQLQGFRGQWNGRVDGGPWRTDVLRLKLQGANRAAKLTALNELAGKSNYFIGIDPKESRTAVPTYAKVKYEDVYSGIDLIYHGNQRQLEFGWVVSPGADLRATQFTVKAGNRKSQLTCKSYCRS